MRYVLIVMCLFSASVQAVETWVPLPESQTVFGGEIQFHSIQKQKLFDSQTKMECCFYDTFMFKMLFDKVPDTDQSHVLHMQIKCWDKKATKYRTFYEAIYEGRMATGNVTYRSEGAPWLPISEIGLPADIDLLGHFDEVCEKLD
jgi:hypothetical protein